MNKRLAGVFIVGLVSLGSAMTTHAAPTGIDITSTIADVSGSFVGSFAVAQTLSGSFIYDTYEANADPGAITTPSANPGHEFSSFYEFSNAPYGVSLSTTAAPGFFTNTVPLAVIVNDNLPLTADEIGGVLPDGTYDWIEILGSTTVSICLMPGGVCAPDEFSPADGEEWTLAIFGDANWFTDGSLIPDNLPAAPTTLLVGFEFDAAGNEIGAVFATVDTFNPFTPSPLGDLNADGFVGIEDLNLVLGNWNQNVTLGDLLAGDPTGDGFVGIEDLNAVLGNWNAGTPPPPTNTVPEPGTLALLSLASLTALRRHRG